MLSVLAIGPIVGIFGAAVDQVWTKTIINVFG